MHILEIVSPRGRGDKIPILMGLADCEFLCRCAETAPGRGWVIDLGTYAGGSAALLCAICGDGRVVTIDSYAAAEAGRPIGLEVARENLTKAGFHPRLVAGDSRQVPLDINAVALVCLDTLHDAAHVVEELETWLPLLVSGGVVIVHDYGAARYPAVKETLDDFFRARPGWERIGGGKALAAFRKP